MQQQPPIKKQKCITRSTSDADRVLIIVENHAESMDVTLSAKVFEKLGLSVVHAGRQKEHPLILTKDLSRKAQITFLAAWKKEWKLIVLPGGNRAMPSLMGDKNFVSLLKNHIEKNNGLVAAMGASATQILPDLGYIDKLGPTCYPLEDCKVVVREGNIWTAPGLGTATELALTLGEHWFGHEHATRVAEQIGYVQGPWHVDKLHDLKSHQVTRPIWKTGRVKLINSGFWEIVWPKLSDSGWGCDFETNSSWLFWRRGLEDCLWNENRIKGTDWFDSAISVLDCLSHESDPTSKEIMRKFHERIDETIEYEEEKEVQLKKKGQGQLELFNHIVWSRLESLGWRRLPGDVYCTPVNHSPRAELASRECVIRHLLTDPGFRTSPNYLSIVDLYGSCQRTSTSLSPGKLPSEIEALTKRTVPSLSTY
jgi:putative intracellular protease/amidase